MAYKQKGFTPFTIKTEGKKVPRIPKKDEPLNETIKRLERKQKAGTITSAEKRRLNKIKSQMDKFYSSDKKDPFGDK
tara:strand:- start:748 stop:978 length:231 start_codon:yes stop_codon:yes gene_type:complete